MVHALAEIHRTLKPNGILIDLRPIDGDLRSIEIASMAGYQVAGRLNGSPGDMSDDEAAFKAMDEVKSQGWFISKKEETLPYFYYWDTPSEMKEVLDEDWDGTNTLAEDVYQKARSIWASANADARMRVRVTLHIARWEKHT
jgi:hypothetical protein